MERLTAVREEQKLKRQLNAFDLTLLGIGSIIGTGIFVLSGIGAAHYAGPAVVLSFIAAGVVCGLVALLYAELTALVPASGSIYTFSYLTLGEAAAWIMAWNLLLEYTVAASATAVGWSGYAVGILQSLGIQIPESLTKAPADGGIVNLPAIAISLGLTLMLVIGTKTSARANAVLVAIKLGAIFLFLGMAAPHVDTSLWVPYMPFGVAGVWAGAAIVFFAFLGFDALATATEEAKNAQRNMPIAIMASFGVCALLYLAVSATLTGVVSYKSLDTPEPLSFALRALGYQWGSALVATGALAGLTTVLLMTIYGQTRIYFVMARDKLLPDGLAKVHPRFHTPHVITWVAGFTIAAMAGFINIEVLAELANIGTLFAFIFASLGVMILRRTQPDVPRSFACPWIWIIGPAAILGCLYLMSNLPLQTWIRFGVWTVVGLLFYAVYGYHKSPFNARQSKAERPEIPLAARVSEGD
ncbi:MAG TPA: amino acid permease [Steroidobacter sp.]|nr:amino acid permease [Steroidobacter sp.]